MSMYVAVKDIGPLDREKAIRVKCVICYEIPEKGSTEIKSREVLFCDKEALNRILMYTFLYSVHCLTVFQGTFIHLNMQNNDVKKYNNVFIEGKLYSVKKILVFTHYYMYKTCDHKYMIRPNYKTQVKAIKSKGFPTKMFQLKNYDSLKDPTQVNDKVLFDLIGRVVEIHPPVDKIIVGRPAKLIDFKMADNEGNTLQCTVWDSHVAAMLPYYDAGLKEPLILVLQLCRAKVVNGEVRITSCYDATQLHFNASYQEFADFRSQLTAPNSPLRSISTATVLSQSAGLDDFTRGALTVTTVFNLLKKKQNGEFYVPAEIVAIEGSFGWMYISCMSPGSNRKLSDESGELICTNCDKKYKEGMARYRVRVIVLDKGLDDAPFLLWDRECSELVGIPAHSLYTKYNKVSDIPKELETLVGMRMVFRISLKMEFMKGANSAYTVMKVLRDEALVSAYCSKLIEDQDKDMISKMLDEDEEEEEDSDQEASNGDNEVNSPLNLHQSQSLDNDHSEADGVKRSLMDQFSSSSKKGKTVDKKEATTGKQPQGIKHKESITRNQAQGIKHKNMVVKEANTFN
ncbi:PREDICTED: uncharacterized protein LOC109158709 [Ipomoea nil]|uniref:uncharacterized protein LOC109158709 n=1 Tax=Ipomoea nil TaxID=35883 RepID=UPI00090199BA|nr:PREDICTED: uncharacterized protein LOC109158709 [Ipomoea nil]